MVQKKLTNFFGKGKKRSADDEHKEKAEKNHVNKKPKLQQKKKKEKRCHGIKISDAKIFAAENGDFLEKVSSNPVTLLVWCEYLKINYCQQSSVCILSSLAKFQL